MAPSLLSVKKQTGSKSKNGQKKERKVPKNLTAFQLKKLEMQFEKSAFVTRDRRLELEKDIGFGEQQIKVWFQNRRNKERRKKQKNDMDLNDVEGKVDEYFLKFWKSFPGIFLLDPQEQTLAGVVEPSPEEPEFSNWDIQNWILEEDKSWQNIK